MAREMLTIDASSGALTFETCVIDKSLKRDAFITQCSGFDLLRDTGKKFVQHQRAYGLEIHLTPDLAGFLTIWFLNDVISHIHIDDAPSYVLDTLQPAEEQKWWELQENWIPQARQYITLQVGTPHQIRPSELIDEDTDAPPSILKKLEDWTYQFAWGRVGATYVSNCMAYRIWIGYGSR
jgi:hypothetical protein